MNDTIAMLKAHRSIRKFSDQDVSDDQVAEIVACAQAAATSSNVQATSVVRVRDASTRAKLAECAGGQPYVASAPVLLMFCADLARPAEACRIGGGEFHPGMTEHFMIATIDVALAAQNAVIAAESLGMGICYIGGIRNKPQEVSDLLQLPEQVYPVFGLCLGFPDQAPEVKPRLPLSAVLHEEVYDASRNVEGIAEYDPTVRHYYSTRTGGTKDSSWSQEMSSLLGKESRPHMRDFLKKRGFEMK